MIKSADEEIKIHIINVDLKGNINTIEEWKLFKKNKWIF
jgi:hypothetical protein